MNIYRDQEIILSVDVDNKTQLKQSLQGDDKIHCDFTLDYPFQFRIGDYTLWNGKKYTLLKEFPYNKVKSNEYKYTFQLESDLYYLLDALFFFDGSVEFSLMGDLQKFAELIVSNLNRVAGPGVYSLGSYPATEVKNLTFQSVFCLNALQTISKEFEVEYDLSNDGKEISFSETIGTDTGLSFEFKKGLRNIERKKISDKNIVTNLYAFGGSRNIPASYDGKRLKIDMLEKNVNLFGKIEGTVSFDDIYPKREGVVSAVYATDILKFYDSSMNFDINDQLISGVNAKITFNSGYLSGYEFEVHNYNEVTKEFDLIEYQDTNGNVFPNNTLKIQVGDKYVIHDIDMPQTYIDDAESKLQTKAQEYHDENSLPNVIYSVVPDYVYLRKNNINLRVGDIIEIVDKDFNITYSTRILNLTQSLANPFLYSIKVGDKVSVGYITQARNNQQSITNTLFVEREDRTVQLNRLRRGLLNIDALQELIFDPDGYFDTDKIKPLSIETSMLNVGAKGQQFTLSGSLVNLNFNGNPALVEITPGDLTHFTIDSAGIRTWNINDNTFNLQQPEESYYIYAECNRTSSHGEFVITKDQIQTDALPNVYYFLIGVIHKVIDDVRGISLTYGQSTINGRFITTGRIQSADQNNYFDLDHNSWVMGNGNSGMDWNVTNPNTLTIKGGVMQNPSGNQTPIIGYRGDWDVSLVYYPGEQVSYNGSSFVCDVATTAGIPPTDSGYWTVSAIAGATGETGPTVIYRGVFNQNVPYYRTSIRRDAVYHNGSYWLKKTYYDGGPFLVQPFDSSNWEPYGAQFDSVATNTLLAENATIADWVVKSGKISSQSVVPGTSTPKVILDGQNGILKMSGLDGNSEYLGKSEIKDEGIFIESAGDHFANAIPGALWVSGASIMVERDMPHLGNDGRLLTAVYGKAVNTSVTGCRTFGGYFVRLMARGLFTSIKKLTDTSTIYLIESNISTVICKHTSGTMTVYLPLCSSGDQREKGRIIIIKSIHSNTFLSANVGQTIDSVSSVTLISGQVVRLQFDGEEWHTI